LDFPNIVIKGSELQLPFQACLKVRCQHSYQLSVSVCVKMFCSLPVKQCSRLIELCCVKTYLHIHYHCLTHCCTWPAPQCSQADWLQL